MKGKIIDCTIQEAWYRNRIGQVYPMKECTDNTNFYIVLGLGIIRKDHVELINE